MTPAHPTCTNESLFNEAGWMCIDTACRLAAWEMSEEVPEARPILDQARYAVKSLCEAREVSELNWQSSRRRLGTPGIQRSSSASPQSSDSSELARVQSGRSSSHKS